MTFYVARRERVPSHQQNYRQNNYLDDLQHNYNVVVARMNALQQQNDQLSTRLVVSQRDLQLASLACNDAMSQSASFLADAQQSKQHADDLERQHDSLVAELQKRTSEFNSAVAQLSRQAVKYQDMKKKTAAMEDMRVENERLKKQIAQLEGAAQVSEVRIVSLERQQANNAGRKQQGAAMESQQQDVIKVPSTWGPKEPHRLRLKNSNAPKTPMTTRGSVSERETLLVAEAMQFIDVTNERTKADRDFDTDWKIAKNFIDQKNMSFSSDE